MGIAASLAGLALLLLCIVVIGVMTYDNTEDYSAVKQEEKIVNEDNIKGKTLENVEKWYKNQMPAVSQNLVEYSKNVQGISNMNVDESKFLFGEDLGWYNCHYTYYFFCNVNGERCIGEARAFMKYMEDGIEWFHFEIFRKSDGESIVEVYDESSDARIEAYYKELISQYE